MSSWHGWTSLTAKVISDSSFDFYHFRNVLLYFLALTIYGLVWYVPEGLKLLIAYFTKIHFTYSWWKDCDYIEGNIWSIISIGSGDVLVLKQQIITWTNDDRDFWCHKVSPSLWNTTSIIDVVVNSLRPSDAIWRHRSGSTLAQVMACCLTASSHYLNQCWLIICKVLWYSSEGNFIRDTSASYS